MAVQQVEHHVVCRVGVPHKQTYEFFRKSFFVGAFLHQKVHHLFGEGVVHYAVELIALQKTFAVVPVFPYQYGVGLQLLYRFSQFTPEPVGNFVGNVQTPTVYVKVFYPIGCHINEVALQFLFAVLSFGMYLHSAKQQ